MNFNRVTQEQLETDLKNKYQVEEGDETLYTTTKNMIENYLLFARGVDEEFSKDNAVEGFFNFRKSLVGIDKNGEDDVLKNISFIMFKSLLICNFHSQNYYIQNTTQDLPCILFQMLNIESKTFKDILHNTEDDVLKTVLEFLHDISILYAKEDVNSSKEAFIESAYFRLKSL